MGRKFYWRGVLCALLLATTMATAAGARGQCDVCWASIWGFFNTTQSYARTSSIDHTTFTKVRISGNPGLPRYCGAGSSLNGSWCDASHSYADLGSNASQYVNVRLCGLQSAESLHWINDDASGEADRGNIPVENINCDPPYPPPNQYCEYDWSWEVEDYVCNSPIIIDTSNNPNDRYLLSSARNGVLFDITGTGTLKQVAWPVNTNRVRFLAIDRDGNGKIDDGTELFGSNTLSGQPHGFLALAFIEPHNGDAVIDARDSLFSKLLLWADRNRNGISEPSELAPASSELEAIGLSYYENERTDRHGNWFRFTGWARQAQDRRRPRSAEERELTIHDVYFTKVQ